MFRTYFQTHVLKRQDLILVPSLMMTQRTFGHLTIFCYMVIQILVVYVTLIILIIFPSLPKLTCCTHMMNSVQWKWNILGAISEHVRGPCRTLPLVSHAFFNYGLPNKVTPIGRPRVLSHDGRMVNWWGGGHKAVWNL